MLDIKNKIIVNKICQDANTLLNFYDEELETYFSKLESQFADLCRNIFNKLDKDDIAISNKLNNTKTRNLIRDWAKANYGRIFFNDPRNVSIGINSNYDKRKRNEVIKKTIEEALPEASNNFIDNSYITLFRNSTKTNFILGACHWIENEINGYGIVLFPISPEIAICLIEMEWYTSKKNQLKKNEVAYLNYVKGELVNAFNKYIFEVTNKVGLNEIYSCNEKELEDLII